MPDDLIESPETVVYDGTYFRGRLDHAAAAAGVDIKAADYLEKRAAALTRIARTPGKDAFVVLAPDGTPLGGSPGYQLSKLVAEIVIAVQTERGPTREEYMAEKARSGLYVP